MTEAGWGEGVCVAGAPRRGTQPGVAGAEEVVIALYTRVYTRKEYLGCVLGGVQKLLLCHFQGELTY